MTEPVVTIKFTQSEVKKLIESLKVIKEQEKGKLKL